MTGVILFTAGRRDAYQDYQEAVARGISYEALEEYLADSLLTKLRSVHSGRVPFWGTQREVYWDKTRPGDEVLFYHGGEFVGRATVLAKAVNLPLAKDLWRALGTTRDDADPWKYILFFENVEPVSIPIEPFNTLFGYKPNFIPEGVMRIHDDRVAAVSRTYGGLSPALDKLASNIDLSEEVLPDHSQGTRRRRPKTIGNPEKGKALQEMYRQMIGTDTAQ